MPIGGHPIKYEMDKEAGTLFVEFLYTPMRYPGNYGFVPHTLSGDGDPIDVLVSSTRPLVPGCVINVRPIGVLKMEDNAGKDEKIIAVPSPKLTLRYEKVKEYTDLSEITCSRWSTSSSTTRISNPENGSRSKAGTIQSSIPSICSCGFVFEKFVFRIELCTSSLQILFAFFFIFRSHFKMILL